MSAGESDRTLRIGGVRLLSCHWYLAVGAVLIALYYLVPAVGLPSFVQVALYSGISTSASVCLVVGTRGFDRGHRRPWLWLAAGQFSSALADIAFFVNHLILGDDVYPSIADALYLMEYPLMAVALAMVVRRRTPGWDLASVLDAGIVAVSAALLSWIFLIDPLTGAPGLTFAGRVVSAAYPIGDLLLLCVAARLMLGAAVRAPAFHYLAASLVLLLAVDTAYGIETITGVYQAGGHLDALWMAASLMLGAAGLNPSLRQLTERSASAAPDATAGRLAVLAVAAVLAPAAEIAQYLRGAALYVPLVACACVVMFLLVLTRMAGLVATQRRMAITDGLTELRTRRYFEQALASETARSQRSGEPIGLLLLDLDHFKRVNDTYGHAAGDRVLVEVAHRLRALSRAGDVVARFGGEEFAVLLPSANGAQLAAFAERVRVTIGGTPIAVTAATVITVSASIGAASRPAGPQTADELVLAADRALYAAKDAGRNQVRVAADPDVRLSDAVAS